MALIYKVKFYTVQLISDSLWLYLHNGNFSTSLKLIVFRYKHLFLNKFRNKVSSNSHITQYPTKFSADWFTSKSLNWDYYLKFSNTDLIALEIGSFEGKATLYMLNRFPGIQITCVDPWQDYSELPFEVGFGSTSKNNFEKNIEPFKKSINQRTMTSDQFFFELKQTQKYDLIYIDGSHEGTAVYNDAINAHQVIKNLGIIIFDDYLWRYFRKEKATAFGINKFLKQYKKYYKIKFIGHQVILQRNFLI